MPDIGDKAPDFILASTVGEVRLSKLSADSKVLLAFYTEDFTPLCASEVSVLKDDFEIVEDLGAKVLAVSADNVDSHQKFADSLGGVPFPLAADVELAAARAFEVVDDGEKRSRRAIFVIDRGGTILHAEPWFQPANPTQYEDIFRALGFEA
ncbi:MAG: redoxin domain-containing protein [Chloroflexi bacterium]|nr:redoxin domain-containing protein [Chloroflexota bacterium]